VPVTPRILSKIDRLLDRYKMIESRKFAKGSFIEKEKSRKLLLQKLTTLCSITSMVLLIFGVLHSVYTLYNWGFWGLKMFRVINSWTTPPIIGITMLGKVLQRLAK